MAVLRVETTKHVEHLTWLRDGLADVAEVVGEGLELGAVVGDGHVTLVEVAELCLIEDGALELVVVVQVGDGRPEGERIRLAPLMNDA